MRGYSEEALRAVLTAILLCAASFSCIIGTAEEFIMVPDEAKLAIAFPRDGDILNHNDGQETADGLLIEVRGSVGPGVDLVAVNGTNASCSGGFFSCSLLLTKNKERIVAETGEERVECSVYWDKGSRKRYRFSIDDNIQFLKDLGLNPDQYPSLFDHWYLAFWRDMHLTYGTKVHFNIYYQTDEFDLTQMPDIWKDEWRRNASWLRLSFHALQDKPDRPYRNAGYAQIAHDHDLVCKEIRRFAGAEIMGRTTTVHWAECPKKGVAALRDRGVKNLIGLFNPVEVPHTTCYYLTPEQSAHCDSRPAWHDHDIGMTFIPCAMVVNSLAVEEIVPRLDKRAQSPHTGELVELLIHEQYFRKELGYYQPDVMDKVRTALEWVSKNGYEPAFWSETLF